MLVISSLIGTVHCFAKNYTADEINTRIGGIISYRAASLNAKDKQGIIDYYASNEMTLGGEWYVLSFIQSGYSLDYSKYERNLIKYLKNNEVYSATSREKFALTLLALNSSDSFAKSYISDTADEVIGKQGIMSLIFGLHLLNNGCKSNKYTSASLVDSIFSLQNPDGGWANSGDKSDVDVTAMALEALYPYKNSHSLQINKAVKLLSSRQSENGDFFSYGVYNAESTAQVIIALSSLGIDAGKDSRFIKNGNSVLDGLEIYRNSNGGFSHKTGDSTNNSATFQALNALVAYSRFVNGKSAFYAIKISSAGNDSEEHTTKLSTEKEISTRKDDTGNNEPTNQISSNSSITDNENNSVIYDNSEQTENTETYLSDTTDLNEQTENALTVTGETNNTKSQSEINKSNISSFEGSISLTKEFKIKLIIQAVIILIAIAFSVILFILKKRNKKNFIVIAIAALILIISVFFIRIQGADDYYNSPVTKDNITGVVTLSVRCDTIAGKNGAPKNPVIIGKTECNISKGDTVYDILAEVLREKGIPFEHNASYYISGIDNLYEYQFGELSGWMYRVNGETPSVGCGEYVLNDGDVIEWLYTCEIGNDLN